MSTHADRGHDHIGHEYVDSDAGFEQLVRSIEGAANPVAVDIEAELNLHVYGERFCLLQIYTGKRAAAVDPFAVSIEAIKDFLESERIVKIVYDAASDRALMYKVHGILMRGLVDLKPAVELLGMRKQGLDSVLEETLGIDPPGSKKRFQQYNWTKRPIRPDAVDYALRDVIYLYDLRDELFKRLDALALREEYEQLNRQRQERVPQTDRKPGVFRSRRFERLPKDGRQEFERLYQIREGYAKRLDLPPNTVLSNNHLFALAAGKERIGALDPNRRVPAGIFEEMRSEMANKPRPAERPGRPQ
jgi:ribonuclease D